MADDINSYALNLAFQLQAAPAIASLSDILSSITNIQNGIQRVGAILSGTITTSLEVIQEQFAKITVSSTDISKTTTKLETDLAAVQRHYEEIDKLNAKTAKTGLKSFLDFDKMRKWIPQLLKEQRLLSSEAKTQSTQQEKITNAIKTSRTASEEIVNQSDMYVGSSQNIAAIWQNINNSSSQSVEQGKNQIGVGQQVAVAWANAKNIMGGAAGEGNKHIAIGNTVAAAWAGAKSTIIDTVAKFAEMLIGIQAIKASFALFVEEENKFNTANYRLYGQQKEIIGQVNKLTVQYGLMRRPAMEAMAILGATIRGTDDDLTAMVDTNVKFSKILGVNQKDLADWQRAMKSMGIKDADTLLLKYADTMRQLGMSAAQMGRLLGDQAKNAAVVKNMFGPEGAREINEYTVRLTGLGNKMGWSTEQVNQFSSGMAKHFSDPQLLKGIGGVGRALTEGYDTMSVADKAKADLKGYVAMRASSYERITDLELRQIAIRQDANKLGFEEQGYMGLLALNNFKDANDKIIGMIGKSAATIEEITASMSKSIRDKAYADAKKAGPEALKVFLWNEATTSLSDKFTKMWSTIEAAFSNFFIRIEPALSWFIESVLTPVVDMISWLINLVSFSFPSAATKTDNALKQTAKAAEPVVGWLEWIGSGLVAIGGFLGVVIGGVIALGAALVGLATGIAMWWWFMSVTNTAKLLAIAVAATAVGGGIVMVAYALKMLSAIDLGALIGSVLALAAVLAMVAVAVYAVGNPAGLAGAIALSLVMLALGGTAILLAYAFSLVTESVIALYKGVGGSWGLVGFGIALVAFGIELTAAAVTIGIGATLMAIAMIPLGIAMGALSVAMYLISDNAISAIEKLSDGRLQKLGDALGTLAPGVAAFIAEMGYGIEFSSGMGGLASGINKIDPAQTMVVGNSIMQFGKALEVLSKFNFGGLSSIGPSISSFADTLTAAFDALTASVNRAVGSITFGMAGVAFVVWTLQSQIAAAFVGLLSVIPTITDVTDRVAAAIESGQDKIKTQIDTLKESFVALESISDKLGVPLNIEERDKKKVMAETISTVQVKTETTGGVTARWKQEEMQQRQVDLMNEIAESVNKITGGNNMEDVSAIRTLLATYLPKMGESPSKLSTRLNNWS